MITTAQAAEYLDATLGISVPSFALASAVELVEACEPAMTVAGYSDALQVLVQSMAVAVIAAGGLPRRVSQQGAPSGASRGFKYTDGDLTALRRALSAKDTAGTVAAVIGPDPANSTMLMVVC